MTLFVEMTLFDLIQELHCIAKEKAGLAGHSVQSFVKKRGTIKQIADELRGGPRYSQQTIRTLAGAALRIKPTALKVLGQIMTEENLSLAKRMLEMQTCEMIKEEDIFDARVYKNMISTSTIRAAKIFLDADEQDQVNAFLRLRYAYQDNGFRCFQAARLNKETERSKRARRQVYLMNRLMGTDKGPEELALIEKKIVSSSILDDELDKLGKNADTIIPTLISVYQNEMPLEAGRRCSLDQAELERRNNTDTGHISTGSQEERNTNSTCEASVEYGTPSLCLSEHRGKKRRQALCPLEHLKVRCLNLSLEEYFASSKTVETKFDLVTGDPSQLQLDGTCNVAIDAEEANEYVGILKYLVRDYGWVLFYTTGEDYGTWCKAFRANDFHPLGYPWPMVRDTETIQKNDSLIPQNITEYLVGAQKKGIGKLNEESEQKSVVSRKRKFGIIDGCPEPAEILNNPNTGEPLRSNQRSAEPIGEILNTFCPPNGHVLDGFAGTMETAEACFMTGRTCVGLEADKLCFDISLRNLKEKARMFLEGQGSERPMKKQKLYRTCANTGALKTDRKRRPVDSRGCLL